ncbi:hypothetical protein K2173_019602 [Erythroxylum novogranatense]|uniref:NAC domain-containing protein n=1 Tax=Erythroxylum novogranatense TaxID=1862640 RepID=A0AAV8UBP8_9ROSI|nr:hypothetical protein K2173_019602 [Erythroxylum novogranatense]
MDTKVSSEFQLPPGFRFHPSDEELIVHYLKNKVTSRPLPASIIADIDLYKYNPWELPKKALFGGEEWYFFTPRDRKYPNGARPNRTASAGYWKATGTDKPIFSSNGKLNIGVKKALVFYKGRPPKGVKTDWIMHEYRLLELDTMLLNPKKKGPMRLDDWVLCRVRQKNVPVNAWEHQKCLSFERPAGFFPKAYEPLQTNNKNSNVERIKNDCPMLPYIFASQAFPCINRGIANFSFQSSDKAWTYQNDSDEKRLQFSVTPFSDLLNPLKRKFAETNHQEDSILPIKKPTKEETVKEEVDISTSNDPTDVNLCGTDQSEGSYLSPAQWNSLMQYQELDHLDFTESN